jgi:hypothetical protein
MTQGGAAAETAQNMDLWSLYDLDFAEVLPCPNARRFLWYLASPTTRSVRCMMNVPQGHATMTIYGPIADEAIHDAEGKGARLTVEYKLTKDEVWEELTHEERRKLAELCRDKREAFSFELWCQALRLARVV